MDQGLTNFRVLSKNHKIHRMAGTQRHTDLAVGLEAANASTMSGTRVDDHVGAFGVHHQHTGGRQDAQQLVIDRVLQTASVHDHLISVIQHRRCAGLFMALVVVAALAQHIHGQRKALRRIQPVIGRLLQAAAAAHGGQNRLLRQGQLLGKFEAALHLSFGNLLAVVGGAGKQSIGLPGLRLQICG